MKYGTPILLIFFNRPDTFIKVFEVVQKLQPETLFLAQDGARDGSEDDIESIRQCREIASKITWKCDVKTNYSNINLGCGMRPASAISWAFEYTDKLIIIEDDCIPEMTFFPYCENLLEKYEKDERISYISGLNHFIEWDCGRKSYFFAKTGAIWAWATWKRSWMQNDYYVDGITDSYIKKLIPLQFSNKRIAKSKVKIWIDTHNSKDQNRKLSYWDIQWGFVKYSQNQLVIVPQYNQICNIGVGAGSTHARKMKDTKYIKGKNFVFIPTRKLEMPLIHPSFVLCDVEYDKAVYKVMQGTLLMRIKQFILKQCIWLFKKLGRDTNKWTR